MATRPPTRIPLDVSDEDSYESLSFAGLLSVKDLQPHSVPADNTMHINKLDHGLVSGHATPVLTARTLNKNSPVDTSISSGQLQLQALLHKSEQTHNRGFREAAHSNNKKSRGHKTERISVSDKPTHESQKHGKEEHDTSRSSFGHRILKTFVSPCRECHAEKPAVKNSHSTRRACQAN